MLKKIFSASVFLLCVACASTSNEIRNSTASFGALTGKSKIVQKPTLIKLGVEPLKINDARAYMTNLFNALVPDLEKTNITYQMAGTDIILTIQSHIILDDRMNILSSIKPQLDNMLLTLAQYDRNFIEITGHTSSVGKKNDNLRKSVNEAQSVADYFMEFRNKKLRIIPERIFINGMGESMWIADNSTREGQLLNHRIEIRISPLI
ncbi:OmpA family protein [bacterium]|nr:OmpA family protein [bacterium]